MQSWFWKLIFKGDSCGLITSICNVEYLSFAILTQLENQLYHNSGEQSKVYKKLVNSELRRCQLQNDRKALWIFFFLFLAFLLLWLSRSLKTRAIFPVWELVPWFWWGRDGLIHKVLCISAVNWGQPEWLTQGTHLCFVYWQPNSEWKSDRHHTKIL